MPGCEGPQGMGEIFQAGQRRTLWARIMMIWPNVVHVSMTTFSCPSPVYERERGERGERGDVHGEGEGGGLGRLDAWGGGRIQAGQRRTCDVAQRKRVGVPGCEGPAARQPHFQAGQLHYQRTLPSPSCKSR